MIHFDCPHCAKAIRLQEEFAGRRGMCPHCKQSIQAPARPGPPESDRAGVDSKQPTRKIPLPLIIRGAAYGCIIVVALGIWAVVGRGGPKMGGQSTISPQQRVQREVTELAKRALTQRAMEHDCELRDLRVESASKDKLSLADVANGIQQRWTISFDFAYRRSHTDKFTRRSDPSEWIDIRSFVFTHVVQKNDKWDASLSFTPLLNSSLEVGWT